MSTAATTFHPKSLGEIPRAFQNWWVKYHGRGQSRIQFSWPSQFEDLLVIRSRSGPGLRLAVQENQLWYEVGKRKFHLILDDFDVLTKVNDRFVFCEIKLRHASPASLRQSLAAVENAKNPVFFRRAINALTGLEHALPQESIEEATAASTDYWSCQRRSPRLRLPQNLQPRIHWHPQGYAEPNGSKACSGNRVAC